MIKMVICEENRKAERSKRKAGFSLLKKLHILTTRCHLSILKNADPATDRCYSDGLSDNQQSFRPEKLRLRTTEEAVSNHLG